MLIELTWKDYIRYSIMTIGLEIIFFMEFMTDILEKYFPHTYIRYERYMKEVDRKHHEKSRTKAIK